MEVVSYNPVVVLENITNVNHRTGGVKMFQVGSSFKSYDEFLDKLNEYSKEKNSTYIIGESTLLKKRKRKISENLCGKLIYQFVRYYCNFYEEDIQKCSSELAVYADAVCGRLVISKLVEEHTHPIANIISPSRLFPTRNFARAPLPAHVYLTEDEDYPQNLISGYRSYKRKKGKKVKKRGKKPGRKPSNKTTKDNDSSVQKPNVTDSQVFSNDASNETDPSFPNELSVTDREMDIIMAQLHTPNTQDEVTESINGPHNEVISKNEVASNDKFALPTSQDENLKFVSVGSDSESNQVSLSHVENFSECMRSISNHESIDDEQILLPQLQKQSLPVNIEPFSNRLPAPDDEILPRQVEDITRDDVTFLNCITTNDNQISSPLLEIEHFARNNEPISNLENDIGEQTSLPVTQVKHDRKKIQSTSNHRAACEIPALRFEDIRRHKKLSSRKKSASNQKSPPPIVENFARDAQVLNCNDNGNNHASFPSHEFPVSCSREVDSDDLFFLSMASEIKDLPRSVRHDVKLKILEVINDSLLIYK